MLLIVILSFIVSMELLLNAENSESIFNRFGAFPIFRCYECSAIVEMTT